jgi:hypothetical protein
MVGHLQKARGYGTYRGPARRAEQWAIFVITALCVEPWGFRGKRTLASGTGNAAYGVGRCPSVATNSPRNFTHSNFFLQEPLGAYPPTAFLARFWLRQNPDSAFDDAKEHRPPTPRGIRSSCVFLLPAIFAPHRYVSLSSNVSRKPSRERRGRGGRCNMTGRPLLQVAVGLRMGPP